MSTLAINGEVVFNQNTTATSPAASAIPLTNVERVLLACVFPPAGAWREVFLEKVVGLLFQIGLQLFPNPNALLFIFATGKVWIGNRHASFYAFEPTIQRTLQLFQLVGL